MTAWHKDWTLAPKDRPILVRSLLVEEDHKNPMPMIYKEFHTEHTDWEGWVHCLYVLSDFFGDLSTSDVGYYEWTEIPE
ncbi:MAG: hypothetical protein KJP02_05675 [Octadecabacter sp.]|nr:hypothetical protein [Octadecabacter sp.]